MFMVVSDEGFALHSEQDADSVILHYMGQGAVEKKLPHVLTIKKDSANFAMSHASFPED